MGVSFPQTEPPSRAAAWRRRGQEMRRSSSLEGGREHWQQAQPRISLIRQERLEAEARTRLAVWLLMIRSRLRRLGGMVVWDRYQGSLGFGIQRPHSPIDRVLRVWMERVVVVRDENDREALVLLRALIDLLLHEAREECDYRTLFPFIEGRINVHIARLMQEADPVLVGEMVFADDVAFGEGAGVARRNPLIDYEQTA